MQLSDYPKQEGAEIPEKNFKWDMMEHLTTLQDTFEKYFQSFDPPPKNKSTCYTVADTVLRALCTLSSLTLKPIKYVLFL